MVAPNPEPVWSATLTVEVCAVGNAAVENDRVTAPSAAEGLRLRTTVVPVTEATAVFAAMPVPVTTWPAAMEAFAAARVTVAEAVP